MRTVLDLVPPSAGYQTRQKEQLLAFLAQRPHEALTAAECAAGLLAKWGGEAPGKSTVYRLLKQLSQEGAIKRLPRHGAQPQRYQMDGHAGCLDSVHLKCMACGHLIHLPGAQSRQLVEMVETAFHFRIDQKYTTLYGQCEDCLP
ncbi:MAG: Fur family transcriptional regulator [Christensenellales bacterium]|jgi:Fur family ferric uptake transcriptional regulator